jgi:cytochrome c biogenesis protein
MPDDRDTPRADVAEEGSESLAEGLWGLLQSVRTTIYVLPILAIATTIGAVIPQKRPPDYYDMAYGATWGRVVTALGFDNIYNSTWFIILVGVLLLNLAACVARSFRRAARQYHGPAPETLARKLEGGRGCWQAGPTDPDARGHLLSALRRARFAVTETTGPEGQSWLLIRRWPLAHYAGIVTHLAIFLVAVGAVLGRLPWTSLDRQLTFAEGETFADPDGKLGFAVRLDDFRMDFYEGTDQPSSYESDIVLLDGEKELTKGTATVNRQVVYRGVSFGQASWGLAGIGLTVTGPDGKAEPADLPLSEMPGPHGDTTWGFDDQSRIAMLGDQKTALVGMGFVPDTQSMSTYPKHPAVTVQVVTGLTAKDHEVHDVGTVGLGEERSAGGYRVRFDDLVYVSTLSVRKDPGLPLVWLGFILVSLGMALMFYVRPRAFLVEVAAADQSQEGAVRVAPMGREFAESDRRIIESVCGARLAPMSAGGGRRSGRRARS